jgi:hypothetical protein
MTDYIFKGEVIKLNAKDYYKWAEMYPSLDLTAELIQMDEEFQIRLREGDKLKKWFSECFARLNSRNKHAARYKKNQLSVNGTRKSCDIPWQEERYDTRWADEPPKRLM